MKFVELRQKIAEFKLPLFTALDTQRLLGVSTTAAHQLLERYTKEGYLIRFKKGLYGIADHLPGEMIIANALYKPSYVSLEYALAYHQLIPEAIYSTTSITTRPNRDFLIGGKHFKYQRVKQPFYTGYTPQKIDDTIVLLASPEKAVVDFLYFVNLGQKSFNDRLKTDHLDAKQLYFYASLCRRAGVQDLISRLL